MGWDGKAAGRQAQDRGTRPAAITMHDMVLAPPGMTTPHACPRQNAARKGRKWGQNWEFLLLTRSDRAICYEMLLHVLDIMFCLLCTCKPQSMRDNAGLNNPILYSPRLLCVSRASHMCWDAISCPFFVVVKCTTSSGQACSRCANHDRDLVAIGTKTRQDRDTRDKDSKIPVGYR